ncbi:MAG: co-chaperone GroES [bacterium]|nr:co-chaperone GroES [bacterium]
MNSFTPLSDQVLIRRDSSKSLTKGGILIPEKFVGKRLTGEVVAVGKGRISKFGSILPMSVAVGDVVMCDAISGTDIIIDGDGFLLINEVDILCIVEEEQE